MISHWFSGCLYFLFLYCWALSKKARVFPLFLMQAIQSGGIISSILCLSSSWCLNFWTRSIWLCIISSLSAGVFAYRVITLDLGTVLFVDYLTGDYIKVMSSPSSSMLFGVGTINISGTFCFDNSRTDWRAIVTSGSEVYPLSSTSSWLTTLIGWSTELALLP